MKTRIIFFLTILVLASLACGLSGAGGDDSAPDEQSTPAPTSVPAASSTPEDPTPTEPAPVASDPTAVPEEPTPLPEPTEAPPIDSNPGPEVIDLGADAYLTTESSNSIRQVYLEYSGAGPDGNPLTVGMSFTYKKQTLPEEASHIIIGSQTGDIEETVESAIIGEQAYTYFAEAGCFSFPVEDMQSSLADEFPEFDTLLINEATLAESGVTINGIVTDRYTLTAGNLNPEDESASPDIELVEGSVYLAQDGGYITRFHLEGATTNASDFGDFAPETEVQVTLTYDFIPTAEALNIAPPAGCEDQASEESEFPMLDDAYQIITSPDGLFYQTNYLLEKVLTFYREEMPALGWELISDTSIGSFTELIFTKDGRTVILGAIQNGDAVPVTITEQ